MAALFIGSVSLILWLVKEKGADVNATSATGSSPLHNTESFDVLNALLGCGADLIPLNSNGDTPLMVHLHQSSHDVVARLLQDPRVQASINVQEGRYGFTTLHLACWDVDKPDVPAIIQLFLQAGAA